jgi:hypothetical protein
MTDEKLGDRVVANVDAATQDMAEITGKVNRGEGTLGALVNDPALYDESTALVRSMRKSWLLGIFRGIRGLLPVEGSVEERQSSQPDQQPADNRDTRGGRSTRSSRPRHR